MAFKNRMSNADLKIAVMEFMENAPDLSRVRVPIVADAVGYCEESLKRKLDAEDVSYRFLLDMERKRRLDQLLERHPDASADVILATTGITTKGGFQRFWKRIGGEAAA